jgi:hypothetical protein
MQHPMQYATCMLPHFRSNGCCPPCPALRNCLVNGPHGS